MSTSYTIERRELPWQTSGLVQSASGYGSKLTSPFVARIGRIARRIYITRHANAGSAWFLYKGEKIFVPDSCAEGDTEELR